MTVGTTPSGAHRQPWKFVAVEDPALKREIHLSAVTEEHESYHHRMSDEWLEALAPLGTDWHKPFLELAPWLVVCFAESHGVAPGGSRRRNYYVQESCGIACGLLIAAIHNMGLVTLTHTPSPMRFLRDILGRPSNERPYILFPVGYPAEDALVPALERKDLRDLVSGIGAKADSRYLSAQWGSVRGRLRAHSRAKHVPINGKGPAHRCARALLQAEWHLGR